MSNFSYVIMKDYINLVIDGEPYQIDRNNSVANEVIKHISNNDVEAIRNCMISSNLQKYVEEAIYNEDGIIIMNSTVYIDGEEISDSLAEQVIRHYDEGIPFKYLVSFIRKVRNNPSFRIRQQLWDFINASMESGGFTIDTEGNIIAYKRVNSNFTDIHTGKFNNSIGSIVTMERKNVDDDPNNTCSAGLHFCAFSYLSFYATDSIEYKTVLVKVDPADVVSIPNDYNFAKARCCKYEVIAEYKNTTAIQEPVYEYEQKVEESETVDDKITFAEVEKFVDEVTLKEVLQLYICINGSGPKKFESKAVAKRRLYSIIESITDDKIYYTVKQLIRV